MTLKKVIIWRDSPPVGQGLLIHEISRSHTKRRTTVGTTPLDELSARRRDLYLTTQKTYMGQTSMPPAGFEPAIPASQRLQTHVFDRVATGMGMHCRYTLYVQFPCG